MWGLEPVGRIDQGKADWLLQALDLAPPKTGSAIRHLVIEAPSIDDTVTLRPKPPARETLPPAPSELLAVP